MTDYQLGLEDFVAFFGVLGCAVVMWGFVGFFG